MTPELRDFVLGLPLAVRKKLGELGDEMGWSLVGLPGSALCEAAFKRPTEIYDTPGNNRAWVPASPISIALHAAKLEGGSDFVGVYASLTGCSCAETLGVRVLGNDGLVRDPTGHRATIALLHKAMAK